LAGKRILKIFNKSNTLYYGWYITITLAITETVSWGILYYAFSVFITPMEAELGWSRGELTGGFSLMLLMTGVMAFPVGAWLDKHGSRFLMTVGSLCASLLVIAWSQVTDLATFYMIWAALGVCGAAILYEPAFAVIATWFTRRRSTALTVVTFAAGFASTIFIPLSDVLLTQFGWRDAVAVLGILLAVTTILPHAFVLRRRPSDLGLLPDGDDQRLMEARPPVPSLSLATALRSRFFWMLTLAFSLSYLSAMAIRVHFIPFLIDNGIDASTAALASGAIGITQVLGRVIFVPIEMRLSGRLLVATVFGLQAGAMFALLWGSSMLAIGIFIVVFGVSFGANTLARPSIVADVFGSASYGRISSIMAIFLTASATIAPVVAGFMYDHYQNYNLVLWLILFLAIGATVVSLITRPDDTQKPSGKVA
jgi:MFS family permease